MAVGIAFGFFAFAWTANADDFIYYSDIGLASPNRSINHIKRANLDGTGVQMILTRMAINGFGGIDFDVANGQFYSGDPNFIFRANLDGSGRTNLTPTLGSLGTGDLELDLLHGKIYWTQAGAGTGVFRANLNGSNAQSIIANTGGSTEGLAVDPLGGKIYFAVAAGGTGSNGSSIGVANLDGSGQAVFKTLANQANPFDVEIDVAGGKLYWNTGGPLPQIQRANLDGTGGIETIFSAFGDGIHLDATDHKLYFSRNVAQEMDRINPDGTGFNIVSNDPDGFNYIAVLHTPSTAVPEPGTLTLLGIGTLGLLGYIWNRATKESQFRA